MAFRKTGWNKKEKERGKTMVSTGTETMVTLGHGMETQAVAILGKIAVRCSLTL